MDESEKNLVEVTGPNLLKQAADTWKVAGSLTVVVYVFGFIIVNLYLARFGVYELTGS
jgi:hypothetical protein